jgi:hypothetical protein
LAVEGAQRLELAGDGDLVVDTAAGRVIQHRPVAYQDAGGKRVPVEAQYNLIGENHVGLHLGPYDRDRPLVVDPVLSYSTYLGGSGWDQGRAIAVDASGAAYLTGTTFSLNFPVTPGAFDTSYNFSFEDVFVAKLNAAGSALVYATYIGGLGQSDAGTGIAVDGSGAAHVSGSTGSSDFPTTPGALDTSHNGAFDAFVAKLDAAGSALVYSTFLGGAAGEGATAIALDGAGAALVTGSTGSSDFPTTPGALDTSHNGEDDAFVTKVNAAGSALVYSTFLGGAQVDGANGIALDGAGAAYVGGQTGSSTFPTTPGAADTSYNVGGDAFVAKLTPAGSALAYSTYLGGASADVAAGIDLDPTGAAYVAGSTTSQNFPITASAYDREPNGWFSFTHGDVFVAKLNPAGSALIYATYLGGALPDVGNQIAVDPLGAASVAGQTTSFDFPTTPDAFDKSYNGASHDTGSPGDGFVAKLDPTGSFLVSSTYVGGASDDAFFGLALDGGGAASVTGVSNSPDFPTTDGALDRAYDGDRDAVVARVPPEPTPAAVVTQNPFSTWNLVNPAPLDGVGVWLVPVNDRSATAGQLAPSYLYALAVGFTGSSALGLVTLGTGDAGKFATFTVLEPNGTPHNAVIPFSWVPGRAYFPLVYRLGEGQWGAWVFDHSASTWVPIGALVVPAASGKLGPSSLTAVLWYGSSAPQCSAFPRADVVFSSPTGLVGTAPNFFRFTDATSIGATPGNCASQTTVEPDQWVRYRAGAGG